MFTLADVHLALGQAPPPGAEKVAIRGVQIDSRLDVTDKLFVAIRTATGDGNQYVGDAFRRGAAAALSQQSTWEWPFARQVIVEDSVEALGRLGEFLRRRSTHTQVIGITGSNGKTTTKEAVAAAFSTSGPVVKSERSFNNELGVPITLAELQPQTAFAVLEMGAQVAGEIAGYCRIAQPTAGVICSVGRAHIGLFGSEEGIAQAKSELAEAVSAEGVLALNRQDRWSAFMRERTSARIAWFGEAPGEGASGVYQAKPDLSGSLVTLTSGGASAVVETGSIGRHLALAFAAAIALGEGVGLDFRKLVDGLASFRSPPRRMQVIKLRGALLLDDSYNANRDSMLFALAQVAQAQPAGRRMAVLGEMLELGVFADEDHRAVGQNCVFLDTLITIGAHARAIGKEAVHAGMDPRWISHFECDPFDPASVTAAVNAAAELLKQILRPGDLVLLKASNALGLHRIAESLRAESL